MQLPYSLIRKIGLDTFPYVEGLICICVDPYADRFTVYGKPLNKCLVH